MSSSQHQPDADMAKLQKKIKQQQRRNSKNRNVAPKLTPAEVRSLGQTVTGVNESGSNAPTSVQRASAMIPLLTTENVNQHQQGNASVNLPTPTQSSNNATDQTQDFNTANGHAHIYAPKPQSAVMAPLVNKGPSRPTSSASYRGISTYRGPEITRTGSMTMFRQPSSDIVSNPLSQFSRPRRSTTGNSPERSESRNSTVSGLEHNVSNVPHQAAVTNPSSVRPSSSTQSIDPPTSTEESRELLASAATSDLEDGGSAVVQEPKNIVEETAVDDKMLDQVFRPSSRWSWRKSFSNSKAEEKDVALLKKGRRRTMSSTKRDSSTHSIPYTSTQPGTAPEMKESLKADLPSSKVIQPTPEGSESEPVVLFEPHPGVRPLSPELHKGSGAVPDELVADRNAVPLDIKGKGKESGTHVYGRCSCCGKIRKPNAFHSELTPVMENENLRTNFSMEADRTSTKSRRRSSSISSANRHKFIPIIPMPVGVGKTVQASIELANDVVINGPGDIIATNTDPVPTQSSQVVEPHISRFKSLNVSEEEAQKIREEKRSSMNHRRSTKPPITPEMMKAYHDNMSKNGPNQAEATGSAVGNITSFPEVPARQANNSAEDRSQKGPEPDDSILEARYQSLQQLEAAATENNLGSEQVTQEERDMHNGLDSESKNTDIQTGNSTIDAQTDKVDQRTAVRRSLPGMSLFKRGRRSISTSRSSTLDDDSADAKTVSSGSNGQINPPNFAQTIHSKVTINPQDDASHPVSVQHEWVKINGQQPGTMETTNQQIRPKFDEVSNNQSLSSRPSNFTDSTKQSDSLQPPTAPSVSSNEVAGVSKSIDRNINGSSITPQSIADMIVPPQPASIHSSKDMIYTSHVTTNGFNNLQAQNATKSQPPSSTTNPAFRSSTPAKSAQASMAAIEKRTDGTKVYHKQSDSYKSSSSDYLPALRFGPQFTQSNSSLHNFVAPNGASTSNLFEKVMQATSNPTTPNDRPNATDYLDSNGHGMSKTSTIISSSSTKPQSTNELPMVNGAEALKMRQEMRKARLAEEERKNRERLAGEIMAI